MPPAFCEAQSVHADEEYGVLQYKAEGEPQETCENYTRCKNFCGDAENRANEAVDHGHLAQRPVLGMRNGDRDTGSKQRGDHETVRGNTPTGVEHGVGNEQETPINEHLLR